MVGYLQITWMGHLNVSGT